MCKPAFSVHISYVHSPIRYAWDLQHQYLKESGLIKGVKGKIAKAILHYMRMWDVRTANGVDFFIANSEFIAKRIKKCYRREAAVIYPPVDVEAFKMREEKEDFYLTASRMVPYKKMDLIVEAFSRMPDKKLVVIGDGPDFGKIKSKATNNITLLGYQPFGVLKDYMQKAKAFVFAAEEDFGITPVEAQACGTPVIAFGKGGALETVKGLGEWYVQLLAESLGKRHDRDGKLVNYGRTPVVAVGSTDMHAQTQQHQDGRRNKIIQFLEIADTGLKLKLSNPFKGNSFFEFYKGLELDKALKIALAANEEALASDGRYSARYVLPRLNEYYLGQLLYFLMLSIAYEGELANVDAYDQPGVEAYKKIMKSKIWQV